MVNYSNLNILGQAGDISKAEEMIRESNRRILDQASDAVLTQANQTVPVTSELLKSGQSMLAQSNQKNQGILNLIG